MPQQRHLPVAGMQSAPGVAWSTKTVAGREKHRLLCVLDSAQRGSHLASLQAVSPPSTPVFMGRTLSYPNRRVMYSSYSPSTSAEGGKECIVSSCSDTDNGWQMHRLVGTHGGQARTDMQGGWGLAVRQGMDPGTPGRGWPVNVHLGLAKGAPTVEEGPGCEGNLVCLLLQGMHDLQQEQSGVRAQATALWTSP